MLVVAALGGNALLRRDQPLEHNLQLANIKAAAQALAPIARDHQLVVTHGNGPQVGLLALQSATTAGAHTWPLDVLDAESEGMIGYLLEQELGNILDDRQIVTLLTQVVVNLFDPAFQHPTKPIGPQYTAEEAQRLAVERGWNIAVDGAHWRRVVASPHPHKIVELDAIKLLINHGAIVICAGGGGIPVTEAAGIRHGVEAVIDKDWSTAVLARQLHADMLLLLTDVPAVMLDWDTDHAHPLLLATPDELDGYAFANGSMGPKVEAASWFVRGTGSRAAIGVLDQAGAILEGQAGTQIVAPVTHADADHTDDASSPRTVRNHA